MEAQGSPGSPWKPKEAQGAQGAHGDWLLQGQRRAWTDGLCEKGHRVSSVRAKAFALT